MAKKTVRPIVRYVYVTLLSLFVLTLFSCGGKSVSAAGQREAEVITARFTTPVELEPQNISLVQIYIGNRYGFHPQNINCL